MIIVEKTPGKKIDHKVQGDLLILDNQNYLFLPAYERDFDVTIDISKNEYGMIMTGTSVSYIAQIDIPARKYVDIEKDEEDEDGQPKKEQKAVPFSMDKVTLTLWGVQ